MAILAEFSKSFPIRLALSEVSHSSVPICAKLLRWRLGRRTNSAWLSIDSSGSLTKNWLIRAIKYCNFLSYEDR